MNGAPRAVCEMRGAMHSNEPTVRQRVHRVLHDRCTAADAQVCTAGGAR